MSTLSISELSVMFFFPVIEFGLTSHRHLFRIGIVTRILGPPLAQSRSANYRLPAKQFFTIPPIQATLYYLLYLVNVDHLAIGSKRYHPSRTISAGVSYE